MMNMRSMMKQAQKLQKQMEKGQAELAATEFIGKSAQGLVETLSDMTTQAINAALDEIDNATKKKLGAFAGKLPF